MDINDEMWIITILHTCQISIYQRSRNKTGEMCCDASFWYCFFHAILEMGIMCNEPF